MHKEKIESSFKDLFKELYDYRKALIRTLNLENIKVYIPNSFEEKNIKEGYDWAYDEIYGEGRLIDASEFLLKTINVLGKEFEKLRDRLDNIVFPKINSRLNMFKELLLLDFEKKEFIEDSIVEKVLEKLNKKEVVEQKPPEIVKEGEEEPEDDIHNEA